MHTQLSLKKNPEIGMLNLVNHFKHIIRSKINLVLWINILELKVEWFFGGHIGDFPGTQTDQLKRTMLFELLLYLIS